MIGHFVVSKVGEYEIFGKSNFGPTEYELKSNFIGFKVERYIPVGFGEMEPHKEAVHVGFGNGGEATELEVKSSDSEPLRRG